MTFQNQLFAKALSVLILFIIMVVSSCKKDNLDPTVLPYNPDKHIYGKVQFYGAGEYEVVIDPISGLFDTIPETRRGSGGISLPIGTTNLIGFSGKERLFIDDISFLPRLFFQDLDAFGYFDIPLLDENIPDEKVISAQYMSFGISEDEIHLIDTDKSIWRIDLTNSKVNQIFNDSIFPNDYTPRAVLYVNQGDDLLFIQDAASSAGMTKLILFDQETASILDQQEIEGAFGFVKYPNEDRFYFLKIPGGTEGFRLMELKVSSGAMSIQEKSTTGLAIDNLSLYLQTIHTASNTYICRGGSSSIENPTNTLYSISLEDGILLNEVTLEDSGTLLNLAGE